MAVLRSCFFSAALLALATRAVLGLRRKSKDQKARSPTWALETIGASARAHRGQGVNIYVMSSGIFYDHMEFGGRAIPAYDATKWFGSKECKVTSSRCGVDAFGRGTAVASAAAGTTYGVAPEATLLSVKVLNDDGERSESRFLKGLDFVVSKASLPAVVVMPSMIDWDGRGEEQARFNALMDTATSKGIVAVAGAGNIERDSCAFWPTTNPLVIGVGGMEEFLGSFQKSSFSNYGACVDLYAPGSAVWGASVAGDDSYEYSSRTGVAAGLVAGAAATTLGKTPSMSPAKVLQALQATAVKDAVEIQEHLVKPGDKNLLLHL